MQIRLTLLLLILFFSLDLIAQSQTNTIVLVEKIAYKAKYKLSSKLCNVLIDSIPFRQNVISRRFSIKPQSYYKIDNRRYAIWDVGPKIGELDIEVVTEIELLDFDLNTIKKSNKRDSLIFERTEYIQKDKFLQIENKRLVETANMLKKEDELETIKSIFNFVIENLEFKSFSNQERGAKRALKTGLGDCTEYSELLIALCRALDIPARYVVGYTTKSEFKVGFHNWVEVFSSEFGWIPLDATWVDSSSGLDTFDDLSNRRIYLDNQRGVKRSFVKNIEGIFRLDVVRIQGNMFSIAVELYNDFQLEECLIYIDRLIANQPENYSYYSFKGMAHARLGEFDIALATLQYGMRLCPKDLKHIMLYSMANYLALKGDKEQSLSYLKASIEAGFKDLDFIKDDPDLKSLRKDKKFIELFE